MTSLKTMQLTLLLTAALTTLTLSGCVSDAKFKRDFYARNPPTYLWDVERNGVNHYALDHAVEASDNAWLTSQYYKYSNYR